MRCNYNIRLFVFNNIFVSLVYTLVCMFTCACVRVQLASFEGLGRVLAIIVILIP